MDIEERVKRLIIRELELPVEPREISSDSLLFEGIGLDSVATLELIVAIEEEFDIIMADEDITLEVLDSVRSLSDYIKTKIV
jgi:acyl carrier protein